MAEGQDHPPFFKFCGFEAGKLILANRTLRWSTPGTLNDPFDMQFDLNLPDPDAGMVDEVIEKLWSVFSGTAPAGPRNQLGKAIELVARQLAASGKTLTRVEFDDWYRPLVDEMLAGGAELSRKFNQEIRPFMGTLKVLCLTDRLDSVQMWSHYADQHRGVALQFGTPKGVDSPWRTAVPVRYLPDLPQFFNRSEQIDFAAGILDIDHRAILDTMIYTKATEWQNEREWRISSGDGRDARAPFEFIPFHATELEAVVFGALIPAAHRAEIAALVAERYPHATLRAGIKSPRRFGMDFIEGKA